MKRKPADRFVVGYPGRTQVLYGKRTGSGLDHWGNGYIERFTRRQAQRALRTFCVGACMFEIVEVPNTRKQ